MGIIRTYIFVRFMIAIFAVFSVCLLLIFLIDFVEVLRQTGKNADVGILTTFLITALRVPGFAEITLPFAVLIGSLMTFMMLSRNSELVIIRAAGMSIWQFIIPGVIAGLVIGTVAVLAYNPLAAWAKAESERMFATAFGKSSSILQTSRSGAWLRQNGEDGPSVIQAKASANAGTLLTGVTIYQFNRQKNFMERLDAAKAELRFGRWELSEVWVSGTGREPVFYKRYILSTFLSPTQVKDSIGSAQSISFWDLPNFIQIAEKAGLSSDPYRVQYQGLLAMPLVLITMVLLAATCSLRSFRFGNIQFMILTGLGAGFGFFMFAEVSRNIGKSGLAEPMVTAWSPGVITCCLALTVLLHQEDG